jgi:DNA-binding transcriptional ArsR family regulator
MLERDGKIKTRRATLYRHYYPVSIVGETREIILAFLRQETSREVLMHLLEHPEGLTQSDIVDFTHLSAPTINWHMSRLASSGIVTYKKEGRRVRYVIKKEIIDEIAGLIKAYHPTLWARLAGRLAELFLELSVSSAKNAQDEDNGVRDNEEEDEK